MLKLQAITQQILHSFVHKDNLKVTVLAAVAAAASNSPAVWEMSFTMGRFSDIVQVLSLVWLI